MEKLRTLIVDDSIVYRKILATAVDETGLAVAAQTASNGIAALERLEQQDYDIVLLDVNMPEMDGIETLKRIKRAHPGVAVIMVSSTSPKNVEFTLQTLKAGAMDFIIKPLADDYEHNLKFVRNHLKLLFAQIRMNRLGDDMNDGGGETSDQLTGGKAAGLSLPRNRVNGVDLIVMAASTGGPVALERVFSGFQKGFSKPVLVVQHMPPDFTKVLARNLDNKSPLRVIEGDEGEIVRAGQAIIAPGGFHMTVRRGEQSNHRISLDQSDFVQGVRPSADVLFKSVAAACPGARILAVVLTGMGCDGTEGVAEMKRKCNCYCMTQNEETSVVYGMPRCLVEAGLSDESAAIENIAGRVQEIVMNGS